MPAESVFHSSDVIRALFTVTEQVDKSLVRDPLRNAGKPWTEMEDDKLRDEFLSKLSVAEIAEEHGRSFGAIECRLDRLGLKKKRFWFFWKKR